MLQEEPLVFLSGAKPARPLVAHPGKCTSIAGLVVPSQAKLLLCNSIVVSWLLKQCQTTTIAIPWIFSIKLDHTTLTCLYLRIFFQIDTEPISLKNLKRRSQFFEQGGQEPTILDLPVPPIAASSRWTWDQEEERKRQEKWQAEQERLLQEQYKREQERLKEEWLKAQQEAEKDISSYLREVSSQPFCGLTSLAEICS
uniref:Uncharacterized protein n=1 Tax=Micrurus lemniscatus lemniscatus TaxID=129467 RepID=A0A2D4H985_MICLE